MKTKSIKFQSLKTVLLLVFSLGILNNYAQNITEQPTEWQLYKEINGIQVYYKYSDCIDKSQGVEQKLVLLKFVNTTSTTCNVKWYNDVWYDGKCWNCEVEDKTEYTHNITIQKGSHQEGSSKYGEKTDLQIFAGYLNHDDTAKLTKFELKNIEVIPVY